MEEPVFMHSSCVLRKTSPEWVVYSEIYETHKMYMRGVTAIEPEWLPKFAPILCSLSEPLTDPPPKYFSPQLLYAFYCSKYPNINIYLQRIVSSNVNDNVVCADTIVNLGRSCVV